jgi:hypothetical protein
MYVLREGVAWMAQQLIEADITSKGGAEHGERSLERTMPEPERAWKGGPMRRLVVLRRRTGR